MSFLHMHNVINKTINEARRYVRRYKYGIIVLLALLIPFRYLVKFCFVIILSSVFAFEYCRFQFRLHTGYYKNNRCTEKAIGDLIGHLSDKSLLSYLAQSDHSGALAMVVERRGDRARPFLEKVAAQPENVHLGTNELARLALRWQELPVPRIPLKIYCHGRHRICRELEDDVLFASNSDATLTTHISLSPEMADLGTYPEESEQMAIFTLANHGEYPLRILNIKHGCGFSLSGIPLATPLHPGKKRTLAFRSIPLTLAGSFERSIQVKCMLEGTATVSVLHGRIKGCAVPLVEVLPSATINLVAMPSERSAKGIFSLYARKPIEIGVPSCSDGATARIERGDARKWMLEATVMFNSTSSVSRWHIWVPILRPEGWDDVKLEVRANVSGCAKCP